MQHDASAPLVIDGGDVDWPHGTQLPVVPDLRLVRRELADAAGNSLFDHPEAERSGATVIAARLLGRATGSRPGKQSGGEMKVVRGAL